MYDPNVQRNTQEAGYIEHSKLVKNLFAVYPHLAKSYTPTDKRTNRFVKRQQHWMKKGFHEKVAFDKTVYEFKDQIDQQRKSAQLLKEIATSNRARSFMDEYEQLAEYEGRLKVKRLSTDLPKYIRSLPQMAQFQIPSSFNSWEKMSYVFKSQEGKLDKSEKLTENEEYFKKAKRLLDVHYEKVNDIDGLRGLSDELILWNARDAYRGVRKNSKQLFKFLLDAGAVVRDDGQLDLSGIENTELKETLKNNPVVNEILNSQGDFSEKRKARQMPVELEESFDQNVGLGKPVLFTEKNPYQQNITKEEKESIESEETRIQRLKGVYHKAKEGSNHYIEKGLYNAINIHQKAIDKLRVVRRHIDQNLFAQEMELTYEPHAQMSPEDFLLDKNIDLDMMNTFLNLSEREVVRTESSKLDYETIKKLLQPKEIIENTVPIGFENDHSVKQRDISLQLETSEFSLYAEQTEKEGAELAEEEEIVGEEDIDMLYTDDFRDEETVDMPPPEPDGKRRKGKQKTKKEIKDLQMRKARLQSALSRLAKKKE